MHLNWLRRAPRRSQIPFQRFRPVLESLECREVLFAGALDSTFSADGIAVTGFDLGAAGVRDDTGAVIGAFRPFGNKARTGFFVTGAVRSS